MCTSYSYLLHECLPFTINVGGLNAKNDELILVGLENRFKERNNPPPWVQKMMKSFLEKLTMKKEFGGLGFRHLHGFNLAMLGK